MTDNEILESKIQDMILNVANEFNELTTSDLQGYALAQAKNIIQLVKALYASDTKLV